MTSLQLIESSLRICGAIAAGVSPSEGEQADGLEALNMIISDLISDRLMVYGITQFNNALTVAKATYTIGSGGNMDTTRPDWIDGATVRDSGDYDYRIEIIDAKRYRDIIDKTTPGRPRLLYYDPDYPKGTIFLYPVPDVAYTLYLDNIITLTELEGLTTTISFPKPYERYFKWELACELAPEFGQQISPSWERRATKAKDRIISMNASRMIQEVCLDIPTQYNQRRYNILEG